MEFSRTYMHYFFGVLTVIAPFLVIDTNAQANPGQPIVEYSILEELNSDEFIGNVALDSNLSRKYEPSVVQSLRYSFLAQPNGDQNNYFSIEERTGVLRTATKIDRDALCPQSHTCQVTLDVAISPAQYFQVLTVKIEILDINDNAPSFPEPVLHRGISEASLPGATVSIPTAEDPDSLLFTIQQYELLPETSPFDLKLQESLDGSVDLQLVLKQKLDRETITSYQIKVIAYDGGGPIKSGSVLINITVEDANDNFPEFNRTTYEATVPEDNPLGRPIVRVHARDADIGRNGGITYGFTARTQEHYGHLFGINKQSGELFLESSLDYEKVKIYHLVVTALDGGQDAHPVHATVIINVQDTNDNSPQITVNTLTPSGDAQISEASDPGTFVAHVSAIDPDSGRNGELICLVEDPDFQLQKLYESQYKVITSAKLNRESKAQYIVSLHCQDKGLPPQTTVKDLAIIVVDANDNPPVFDKSFYTANLQENNQKDAFVVRVNATDLDIGENAEIHYYLADTEAQNLFHISEETGIIRAKVQLDHEQHQKIEFMVVAIDSGEPSLSSTTTVSVSILDVNDEPPRFSQPSYSFGIFENQDPDSEVGVVYAEDGDSPPYNKVEYLLYADDPLYADVFAIDIDSGRIFTTEVLDREFNPVYYLEIIALNRGEQNLQTAVTVTVYVADVNDNAPLMDYPTAINNTVEISNLVPVGFVVARVRGHDLDIGENARLDFAISQGNEDGLFDLDEKAGAITTKEELNFIDYKIFNLTVKIMDGGTPSRSTEAVLYIVIDQSVMYYSHYATTDDGNREVSGLNSTIVIGVGCASGAVIVALIIAIIAIRCLDSKRRDHRYNCRTEAQKMLTNGQRPHSFDQDSDSHSYVQVAGPNGKGRDGPTDGAPSKNSNGSGSRNHPGGSAGPDSNQGWIDDGRGRGSWPTSLNQNLVQNPHGNSTVLASGQSPGVGGRSGPSTGDRGRIPHCNNPRCRLSSSSNEVPHSHPYHALHAQQKNPHPATGNNESTRGALWLPRRDQDSDSACSGEMSNADSGRGGSEEGEVQMANNGQAQNKDPSVNKMNVVGQIGAHGNHTGFKYGHHGNHQTKGVQFILPQRKPPGGQNSCSCCSPNGNHVCIQMQDIHSKPVSPYPKLSSRFNQPSPIQENCIQDEDLRDSGYYGNKQDYRNNVNNMASNPPLSKADLKNFNNCNNGSLPNVDAASVSNHSLANANSQFGGSTTDVADDSSSATSGSYVVDVEDLDRFPGDELTIRESVA